MLNKSIKFFTVFLLAFSVFAGGDDRDEEYYEALDEELATFEAQLAEDLANQAALEAFLKKLAEERAAAARSTEIYQANPKKVKSNIFYLSTYFILDIFFRLM